MAEVWLARKPFGDGGSRYVAIKIIADQYVNHSHYIRMFRAEAELAAALNHANVVHVSDYGVDAGRSYLVMDVVDGVNLLKLEERLAYVDEQLRFRVAAYVIGQLLHALDYAHRLRSADGYPLGIVHRDVSPQNVLLSNNGEVKLTDFGVAHNNLEESSGVHVKGKVRYMPPEQLLGQSHSPTVDLFAVGALLHEMLDRKRFRSNFESDLDLINVARSGAVPRLSCKVPPELDRLRRRLLEPDPAKRIQTAKEALALLKRFPGYGDASQELAELCGSLTGVLDPIVVGPQPPPATTAAGNATGSPRVRHGLAGAKPPVQHPPSPSSPAREPSGPSTGSTTALKEPAVRTGQTELVDLRTLSAAATNSSSGWSSSSIASPSSESSNDLSPEGPSSSSVAAFTELPASWTLQGGYPGVPPVSETGGTHAPLCSDGNAGLWHGQRPSEGSETHPGIPIAPSPPVRGRAGGWSHSVGVVLALLLVSTATMSAVATWWWVGGDTEEPLAWRAQQTFLDFDSRLPWEQWSYAIPFEPKLEDGRDEVRTRDPGGEGKKKRVNPPPRRAEVEVKVATSSGLEAAQVRIGDEVLSASSAVRRIKAGRWSVKWRKTPSEPWQSYKKHDFEVDRRWRIHIGKRGPTIYDM